MMCAGIACLCLNDAFAKGLIADYSALQILFIRNIVALPLALAVALAMGGTAALRSHRPAPHLARGALWILATVLFFSSFQYMGLAEATALIFAAPLFITAISAMFLGEHVGRRRWLAVLAGFAGAMIVVRPGAGAFQAASLLPLAAALCHAALMLSSRRVDPRESFWTLLLYLTAAAALLSGFLAPFAWTTPRLGDSWLFLGVALFGTAGLALMSQAFRLAPAVVVAPFEYSGLIWATGLGWLFWSEIPDLAAFLGATVIVASGVYIVFREDASRGKR